MERSGSLPKLSGPGGSGAYDNYYRLPGTAKANPTGYQVATDSILKAANQLGLDANKWIKPTLELVARESSFNPNAKNPKSSARGLFQFLDGTRKDYGGSNADWNDPYQQALAGLRYIKDRYGTPEKALQFWDTQKAKGNAWY